jgi:DNA mismatch repair protein MutS
LLFLHRIGLGPADRSYGIHVAKLAGLPRSVIAKAQRLLAEPGDGPPAFRNEAPTPMPVQQPFLPMFEPEQDPLREELEALDLKRMTPLEVMNWVAVRQGGNQG